MQADKDHLAVQIETDGNPIDVWELSNFLYQFRAAYEFVATLPPSQVAANAVAYSEHVRPLLAQTGPHAVTRLAERDSEHALAITDIDRENPLEIVFVGIPLALAVAVIISGGEFKGPGFKVKLPPLGTGIAKLRQAFGRKTPSRLLRSRTKKLRG